MSQGLISFLMGYLIFINIISYVLVVIITRQSDQSKLNVKKVNTFLIIFTILGGFIGLMVAGEMTGYKDESIVLKRVIPIIVFVVVLIILGIIYKQTGGVKF